MVVQTEKHGEGAGSEPLLLRIDGPWTFKSFEGLHGLGRVLEVGDLATALFLGTEFCGIEEGGWPSTKPRTSYWVEFDVRVHEPRVLLDDDAREGLLGSIYRYLREGSNPQDFSLAYALYMGIGMPAFRLPSNPSEQFVSTLSTLLGVSYPDIVSKHFPRLMSMPFVRITPPGCGCAEQFDFSREVGGFYFNRIPNTSSWNSLVFDYSWKGYQSESRLPEYPSVYYRAFLKILENAQRALNYLPFPDELVLANDLTEGFNTKVQAIYDIKVTPTETGRRFMRFYSIVRETCADIAVQQSTHPNFLQILDSVQPLKPEEHVESAIVGLLDRMDLLYEAHGQEGFGKSPGSNPFLCKASVYTTTQSGRYTRELNALAKSGAFDELPEGDGAVSALIDLGSSTGVTSGEVIELLALLRPDKISPSGVNLFCLDRNVNPRPGMFYEANRYPFGALAGIRSWASPSVGFKGYGGSVVRWLKEEGNAEKTILVALNSLIPHIGIHGMPLIFDAMNHRFPLIVIHGGFYDEVQHPTPYKNERWDLISREEDGKYKLRSYICPPGEGAREIPF